MTRPAAIITGGARGIGLACAEALAGAGFDILIADLAEAAPDGLADRIASHGARLIYQRCDIADLPSHAALVDAAMTGFGRIDCLVNNAGGGAVVGGFLLGALEVFFHLVLPPSVAGYRDAFVFVLVAAILVWRPQGLVGTKRQFGDKDE